MALVIIRHKVKDFAAWKKVFYGHASAQSASGLSNPRLFRSADDPSEVVILFDAADISKAVCCIVRPAVGNGFSWCDRQTRHPHP
jgi:hypothetical protein